MHLRNRTIVGEATVAPSPRVSIDSLPNEILYRIIEFVGSEDPEATGVYEHSSRSPLLQAALVCRRWRHPAQEVLFGWAMVHLRDREKTLAPWLSLDPASHARVRTLIFSDLTIRPDGVPACAAALLESPHIDTLVANSIQSYWPYLQYLKELKRLHMMFITHPYLEDQSGDPPSAFPFQLDALCLDIANVTDNDSLVQIVPPRFVPVLASACGSLKHLQIDFTGAYQPENTASILEVLQPVLDASSTSLRHLHLNGGSPPVELCTAFRTVRNCAHFEITIRKQSLAAVLEGLAASGFCESLERLTINPDFADVVSGNQVTEELDADMRREERLPHSLLGILQSAPFAGLRHVFLPLHYWHDILAFDEESREIVADLEERGVAVFAQEDLPLY